MHTRYLTTYIHMHPNHSSPIIGFTSFPTTLPNTNPHHIPPTSTNASLKPLPLSRLPSTKKGGEKRETR